MGDPFQDFADVMTGKKAVDGGNTYFRPGDWAEHAAEDTVGFLSGKEPAKVGKYKLRFAPNQGARAAGEFAGNVVGGFSKGAFGGGPPIWLIILAVAAVAVVVVFKGGGR